MQTTKISSILWGLEKGLYSIYAFDNFSKSILNSEEHKWKAVAFHVNP